MHKRILSLGLIITLSVSTLIGCSNKNDTETSSAKMKEVSASIGTIKEEISLSGSIKADKSTTH